METKDNINNITANSEIEMGSMEISKRKPRVPHEPELDQVELSTKENCCVKRRTLHKMTGQQCEIPGCQRMAYTRCGDLDTRLTKCCSFSTCGKYICDKHSKLVDLSTKETGVVVACICNTGQCYEDYAEWKRKSVCCGVFWMVFSLLLIMATFIILYATKED